MSYGYPSQQSGPRRRGGLKFAPILIGVAVILFMYVRGCQPGPFGRHQVVALNPQQEAALGLQAFGEVLEQADIVRRGPAAEMVKRVAQRLASATHDPEFLALTQQQPQNFDWQVELIRSDEKNAFCLPGGKIVVYTGILPLCETDAGLATVMGHEIAHALAHHGAERMAQQQMVQVGLGAAGGSMSDMDPQRQQQLLSLLNAGAKFGILKYSRSHESEADHMGLFLMAAAGYDPRQSIHFWERMQQATGSGAPSEFLSTHPSHDTRIHDLTAWMPEAMSLYEASQKAGRSQAIPQAERE